MTDKKSEVGGKKSVGDVKYIYVDFARVREKHDAYSELLDTVVALELSLESKSEVGCQCWRDDAEVAFTHMDHAASVYWDHCSELGHIVVESPLHGVAYRALSMVGDDDPLRDVLDL